MAKDKELPEELPMHVELELYKGQWAIRYAGSLYVFPSHTTKEQAQKALDRVKFRGNN